MVGRIIAIAFLTASLVTAATAADKKFYEFPDAVSIKPSTRFLVFDNDSGSRNVTGSKLSAAYQSTAGFYVYTSSANKRFQTIAAESVTPDNVTVFVNSTTGKIRAVSAPDASKLDKTAFDGYTTGGREKSGIASALVVSHNALGAAHSGHFTSTSNPHSTTAAQVGSPTNAEFAGYTGTPTRRAVLRRQATFGNVSANTINIGTASATTPQLTVIGGSGGNSILTLKRTSGTTVTYNWALAGGGLSFSDNSQGTALNLFSFSGSNEAYIGDRATPTVTSRTSLLSGTTYSSSVGIDKSSTNLVIQSGLGTGIGTLTDILFKTPVLGTTGTTPQTATTKMVLTGSGRLGINQTAPTSALHVLLTSYGGATKATANTAAKAALHTAGAFVNWSTAGDRTLFTVW